MCGADLSFDSGLLEIKEVFEKAETCDRILTYERFKEKRNGITR